MSKWMKESCDEFFKVIECKASKGYFYIASLQPYNPNLINNFVFCIYTYSAL